MNAFLYCSVLWLHIEVPSDFGRVNRVDKGIGIGGLDCLERRLNIGAGHDGVNHGHRLLTEGAFCVPNRCAVIAYVMYCLIDLLRLVGYDEKRLFLVAAVQGMEGLRGHKLENDRIQGLLPAKKVAGDTENNDIEPEDKVPGFHSALLREIDGDEVRPSAGGVRIQAQADGCSAQDSTKYGNKQQILRNGIYWENVRQKTTYDDHQQGKQGELLPNKAEANVNRESV